MYYNTLSFSVLNIFLGVFPPFIFPGLGLMKSAIINDETMTEFQIETSLSMTFYRQIIYYYYYYGIFNIIIAID